MKEKVGGYRNGEGCLKKGCAYLLHKRSEIYQFTSNYRKEFPIGKKCNILKVSKSAFYNWRHSKPSDRDNENRVLLFEIRKIHQQSKASYGSSRITDELRAHGFEASRPREAP